MDKLARPVVAGVITFAAVALLALLLAVLWPPNVSPARLMAFISTMFAGTAGITAAVIVWMGRR